MYEEERLRMDFSILEEALLKINETLETIANELTEIRNKL